MQGRSLIGDEHGKPENEVVVHSLGGGTKKEPNLSQTVQDNQGNMHHTMHTAVVDEHRPDRRQNWRPRYEWYSATPTNKRTNEDSTSDRGEYTITHRHLVRSGADDQPPAYSCK